MQAASVEKRRQRAVQLSAEDHALATQLASISKHAQQKQVRVGGCLAAAPCGSLA